MNWYIVERIHTLNGNYTVRFIIDGVQADCESSAMTQAACRNGWKTNESLTVIRCYSGGGISLMFNRRRDKLSPCKPGLPSLGCNILFDGDL